MTEYYNTWKEMFENSQKTEWELLLILAKLEIVLIQVLASILTTIKILLKCNKTGTKIGKTCTKEWTICTKGWVHQIQCLMVHTKFGWI